MLSSKPCSTTCVIDGIPVTVTYYPNTCDLWISDAYGRRIQKTRWLDSWTMLLALLRDFTQAPRTGLRDLHDLLGSVLTKARYPAKSLTMEAADATAV